MISPDFNARFTYEVNKIAEETSALRRLAYAFYVTGNTSVCDQLTNIAVNLETGAITLKNAYNEEFGRQLRNVEANSANVLKAALAARKVQLRQETGEDLVEDE